MVLLVAIAASIRAALHSAFGDKDPFAPFYMVVLLVAWFGSVQQALSGMALGALASYLFVQTRFAISNPADVTSLLVYLLVSVSIVGVVSLLRRTMRTAGFLARRTADQTERLQSETDQRLKAESATLAAREELLLRQLHEHERVQAEMERLREELERQARLAALGQVASRIAHDLRNTLGVVLNAAFLLRANLRKGQPPEQEVIDMIETEVRNSRTMINNLVASIRPAPPDFVALDLGALVRSAFREVEPAPGSSLVLQLEREPFTIWADPLQLGQVLKNLFKNSCEAAAAPVEITIRAHSENGDELISVRDDGPGISSELRSRLFEPFVSTKKKGAGLGLVICRQIIQRHRGSIRLAEETGHGAGILIR
ncbi:MAG: DUF4118 domain-containing protein, partial [Deltaproteobacteria bacterium]|nr:DUF4118 domain-containing protein [Deltaproteobacteria bacterium]